MCWLCNSFSKKENQLYMVRDRRILKVYFLRSERKLSETDIVFGLETVLDFESLDYSVN